MWDCPETYDHGHGLAGKDGRCPYCHRKIEPTFPNQKLPIVSDMDHYYHQMYDPDYLEGEYNPTWKDY